MKRLAFVLAGGLAIGLSYAAIIVGHVSGSGISLDRVVSLALPALVSALVCIAYLVARSELNRTKGAVSELNAQLLRKEIELDHLSSLDELTALYSRRQFDEQARLEFERAQRYRRPLALMLIEIDDLSALGERLGRLGRGYLLSQVSEILRARLRVNDIGGRYSQESLSLLLPDSGEGQAIAVADKVRSQVAVNSFMGEPYDNPIRLTLSIGIAIAPHEAMKNYGDLEKAGEEALYTARSSGYDSLYVHGWSRPARTTNASPDIPLAG